MTKENFDYLTKEAANTVGFEDLKKDTMAVPFIRLIQAMSPQLKKKSDSYIPEAEEGMLCNSVTGKLYADPLRFVVIKFERVFNEWKPNREGFVQSLSPDFVETHPEIYQTVPNGKGGYDLIDVRSQNVLADTYNYYVLLPDYIEDGVCIVSLAATQLKAGRKLNSLMTSTVIPGTSTKALPHYIVWKYEVVELSNKMGTWQAPNFTFDSFVTPDLLDNVKEEQKLLPEKKVEMAQVSETAGKGVQY